MSDDLETTTDYYYALVECSHRERVVCDRGHPLLFITKREAEDCAATYVDDFRAVKVSVNITYPARHDYPRPARRSRPSAEQADEAKRLARAIQKPGATRHA